jgi:hypothetical protein
VESQSPPGAAGGAATDPVAQTGGSASTEPEPSVPPAPPPQVDPDCPVLTETRWPLQAASAGFSGTYDEDYYPIYDVHCSNLSQCTDACEQAGGTPRSCAHSECLDTDVDYCLPPTYWFRGELVRVDSGSIEQSAVIIMVDNPYRDPLVATDFQFDLPEAARIVGIRVNVTRAADWDSVADYDISLWLGGASQGANRALPDLWPLELETVTYGGVGDNWGSAWAPQTLDDPTFGVGITPMYTASGGNARAYPRSRC